MHLLLHTFGRTVDSTSSVPPLCLADRKSRRVLEVVGVCEVLLAMRSICCYGVHRPLLWLERRWQVSDVDRVVDKFKKSNPGISRELALALAGYLKNQSPVEMEE